MTDLLYCSKLAFAPSDSDAAFELLDALALDYSCYEDRENGGAYAVVYAETEAKADADSASLASALPAWRDCGVEPDGVPVRFTMKKEDWSEVWKKYFHIIHISDRLVIKPSWLKYAPKPGQVVLEIDPGMTFGTGQHATTGYCLKVIDRLAGTPGVKSMIDAGCGSGILSIAGSLLGYAPITAFDNDPDCIKISKENFAYNRLAPESIALSVGDAAVWQPPRQCDLVVANILSHLLIAFRENIVSWVRPGGYLTLAGILSGEFDELSKAFTALGFTELDRFTEKEWTGGLFRKAEK